jgi:hypothetical protein
MTPISYIVCSCQAMAMVTVMVMVMVKNVALALMAGTFSTNVPKYAAQHKSFSKKICIKI